MRAIALVLFSFVSAATFGQVAKVQHVNTQTHNNKVQQQKPYVIMISADGFRYDYAKKYNATHLLALGQTGVVAESMLPSYPSVTFPNHYTIATGLYPSHHGLVANTFYEPATRSMYQNKPAIVTNGRWYGGTPLWTLAEQQQMLSASFYWVGAEATIKGLLPTYYYSYSKEIDMTDRIKAVKDWLELPEDRRPHLIAFYFPQVDHESHMHGPESAETEQAVHIIDSAVYEMTKAVKSTGLDVNFIFLADHGMTKVSAADGIDLPVLDTAKFVISNESLFANLYVTKASKSELTQLYLNLKAKENGYKVYLKADVPKSLHYGATDDRYGRIGDIVMIPDYPHVFFPKSRKVNPGAHGYDPDKVKDMHATFMAWGPNIKKGLTIQPFRNVNVYPIVTKILGLKQTEKIDGTDDVAKKVVR